MTDKQIAREVAMEFAKFESKEWTNDLVPPEIDKLQSIILAAIKKSREGE